MNERTYRCTLWLCHKTAISAEGKMTGQLLSCLANCVVTPLSLFDFDTR